MDAHTESLFQQPLCGKAKPIKRFPVTVILQQGFALHHFPFAMRFFLSSQKDSLAKGSCQLARSGQGANGSIQLYTVALAELSIQGKVIVLTLVFHLGLLL